MSLIAWYPFNGNAKNYGLGDDTYNLVQCATLATPTLDGVGKVTKSCLSTNITSSNNSKASNYHTSLFTLGNYFTLSCWFKLTASNASVLHVVQMGGGDYRGSSGTDSTPCGVGIRIQTTQLCLNCNGLSYSTGYALTVNEWYHCVITLNGSKYEVYLNGSLIYTETKKNPFASGSPLVIGSLYSDSYYTFFGLINDVRYYDNVLSYKEIKEISKGLCLHYKLSRGGTNLLPTNTMNVQGSKWKWSVDDATYGKNSVSLNGVIENDTTYTLSFEFRTSGNRNLAIYVYNSDWTWNTNTGWRTSGNGVKYGTLTFTTPSTITSKTVLLTVYSQTDKTSGIAELNWVKLERGSKATPWTPSTSDGTSHMGLASTEYDCSGYCNDGTISGTMKYIPETPRYLGSYNCNHTGFIYNNSLGLYLNKFTMSFWVKPSDEHSTQRFLYGTFSSWTNNGSGAWRDTSVAKGYSHLIKSDSESSYGSLDWGNVEYSKWNHLALVYTGTTVKSYINGVCNQTKTYGKNGYVSMPVLYIGNSKFNNTPDSETENACYSDFRLYATDLSDDDVKALYSEIASLDDDGTFYVKEMCES